MEIIISILATLCAILIAINIFYYTVLQDLKRLVNLNYTYTLKNMDYISHMQDDNLKIHHSLNQLKKRQGIEEIEENEHKDIQSKTVQFHTKDSSDG